MVMTERVVVVGVEDGVDDSCRYDFDDYSDANLLTTGFSFHAIRWCFFVLCLCDDDFNQLLE